MHQSANVAFKILSFYQLEFYIQFVHNFWKIIVN